MEIQQQRHGAVTSVKPLGPVIERDAEDLRTVLMDVRARSLGRLVLDISGVPFVDGRALEVLLEVTETLAESGQALKLCGTKEVVREALELTDLASMFEHYEDVGSAVRSFL